jgi:DNA polymerase V
MEKYSAAKSEKNKTICFICSRIVAFYKRIIPSTMRKMEGKGTLVPVIPMARLSIQLPFYTAVAAGFPSPADDYPRKRLDLNEYCIRNRAATFFVEVEGDSMIGAGIYDGDILIVDRSLDAKPGDVVIACLGGDFTVKRLLKADGRWFLKPENTKYEAIELREDMEVLLWGVVTYVVHKPYEL